VRAWILLSTLLFNAGRLWSAMHRLNRAGCLTVFGISGPDLPLAMKEWLRRYDAELAPPYMRFHQTAVGLGTAKCVRTPGVFNV